MARPAMHVKMAAMAVLASGAVSARSVRAQAPAENTYAAWARDPFPQEEFERRRTRLVALAKT